MDHEQFLEQVRDVLSDRYPDMDVTVKRVEKLQGQSYTGIALTPEGAAAGATLNLDPYFDDVRKDVPFEMVMRRIETLADEALSNIPVMGKLDIGDYDQMKHRLIMQAVPTEPNRELLDTVPHKEMEDISIVYRFLLDRGSDTDMTTLVNDRILEGCGITAEQLMADAEVYAPQVKPVSIRSLGAVIADIMGGLAPPPEDPDTPSIMVATVEGSINGAGIMGYPDFFKEASETMGGSFFILPSSVHELLLLPEDSGMSAADLSAMVSAVNASEVMPEDRLSDSAYHYDAEAMIFEKASAYEDRMLSTALDGQVMSDAAITAMLETALNSDWDSNKVDIAKKIAGLVNGEYTDDDKSFVINALSKISDNLDWDSNKAIVTNLIYTITKGN